MENSLKYFFRDTRNYFAGNVSGVTRDETIADIVIGLLLCKIYDEKQPKGKQVFPKLSALEPEDVKSRLIGLEKEVLAEFPGAFDKGSTLHKTEAAALAFLASNLLDLALGELDRDVIADAFEEFIGTAYRGGEGQFFTPKNVVQMMVNILDPGPKETVIDPACGSGGFLIEALRHLGAKAGSNSISGIEKDLFLARVSNSYASIVLGSKANIFCENSLANPKAWGSETRKRIRLGSFDVVLTNPPFGSKIPVLDREILGQYELGYDLVKDSKKLRTKQPPQILFIERALQLLKPSGRMGIVLPEGIFGNPSDRYVWEFLESKGSITGIVSLAQEAFQPSTHTKTSVLFFELKPRGKNIFMASATKVGHNKNGKTLYKFDSIGRPIIDAAGNSMVDDDLPTISKAYKEFVLGKARGDHLGFSLPAKDVQSKIYIPDYYNPELEKELEALNQSGEYKLVSVGELLENKQISIKRGKEIGSNLYGTGSIPFVRTSDITNWEIKFDPIKAVSEDAYFHFQKQMDVRPGDIFLVSDGTFLIGRTAMVTSVTSRILYQSHLKKIRVLPSCPFDSYYLLYLLSTEITQKQIRAKTFVQATISTLGDRLLEIKLPISKNPEVISEISSKVKEIVEAKIKIRERTIELIGDAM